MGCPNKWRVTARPPRIGLGEVWLLRLTLSPALCSGGLLNRRDPILYALGEVTCTRTSLCHPGGWHESDAHGMGASISAAICQHLQHWEEDALQPPSDV